CEWLSANQCRHCPDENRTLGAVASRCPVERRIGFILISICPTDRFVCRHRRNMPKQASSIPRPVIPRQ
ncbi:MULTISPECIES: hypothetical protein, partial [unclassified Burkholderia]|uniref:hypothetical protein n=1 Tax=unclassified Burkholderia TaxID=2613784 RepID=UPI002AB18725